MDQDSILKGLFVDKRIDLWWKDLIGQDLKSFSDFDYDKAEKSFPMSEITVSKTIHDKFEDVFSYNEPKKTWFIWDGIIHAPCDGSAILEKVVTEFYYAYRKGLEILDEAIDKKSAELHKSATDDATGEEAVKKFQKMMERKFSKARKFEERLGTNAGVLAVSRRLQVDFTISSDYYEDDRRWFVFKNGVLDTYALRKGQTNCVFQHDSSRNVTKYFDAEASGENLGYWDSFLESSIPDVDSRNFLKKVVGASFMGITKSRMIVNLFGPPGSGKSTFMDAIQKLGRSGAGYCAALDKSAITQTNDQVNFGQNAFKGRRFISVSEPDHRKPIDDDFLKNFTGDEGVKTRTLHAEFEAWTPQGILFVASNAPLKINTRDSAIVDRLHMVEFPNQFDTGLLTEEADGKKDSLEDHLQQDKSRILDWILEGMWMYVQDNMSWNPPQKVIEHRGTIVSSASVALRWLDDMLAEGMLTIDPHNKNYAPCLSVNDAYAKFRLWKSFNGEKSALSKTFFKEDITKKYLNTMRYNDMEIFPYIVKTDKYYKEYELSFDNSQTKSDSNSTFRF